MLGKQLLQNSRRKTNARGAGWSRGGSGRRDKASNETTLSRKSSWTCAHAAAANMTNTGADTRVPVARTAGQSVGARTTESRNVLRRTVAPAHMSGQIEKG